MDQSQQHIYELVGRVRSRWRRVVFLRATGRTALALSCVLGTILLLTLWANRVPAVLAGLAILAVALVIGLAVWGLWPARDVPSDRRVARFIEERDSSLDDRLVSAVDVIAGDGTERPAFAEPMLADANRRAAGVDPADIVPTRVLRRASAWAAAALLLVIAVGFFGRGAARTSLEALSFVLFPSRVTLEVVPGDVRVASGAPLTVEARLVGRHPSVGAQLLRADAITVESDATEGEWQATEMTPDSSGVFKFAIDSVSAPFRYRVVAGALRSPVYGVKVARAPRVTRIDVEYSGASAFGFEPRVETDSGDIFAPAGTDVRLVVHTDVEAAKGQMKFANGGAVDLKPDGLVLSGSFKVVEDTSYRVALADAGGLANPGDVEYFIRTLEDRPPDLQVLRPARDREVTRLEEVEIEARARDDFGIDRLELVYAKGGGPDTVVPFTIDRHATSVTGTHTLQLEDLDLRSGDFVSYYVRARDVARGRPASEVRSDIFFLHVKPFDQEFSLASSQGTSMGGGSNRAVDDVVSAQKEIIVATWKLDRRGRVASGATSKEDIRSVGVAEAELKARVEETASSFRTSVMRDPRRPAQPSGEGGASRELRAGQTLPEEDAMTAAASAMGNAVESLDRLKTGEALPHEMEALSQLLKAQGDVKRREVGRQQAGGGAGDNRSTQDLSGLFDRDLQREQETNYETPNRDEPPDDSRQSALDKIKELARRQDELLKKQQEGAGERGQMTPEERKAEFDKLAREQGDLGQRAEEMAQQMSGQQGQPSPSSQSQGQPSPSSQSQGQPSPSSQSQGQPSPSSQSQGQPSPSSQSQGQSSQRGASPSESRQMRAVSEEMRRAAGELGRQDPAQAAARGSRALGQLRQMEQQLSAGAPDERRRALGETQLEARQLAEAQRRVGQEAAKAEPDDPGRDAMRRLAAEQERLADRAERLQEELRRQASGAVPDDRRGGTDAGDLQRAAGGAAQEIERQRLVERMEQSAEEMRSAAGRDQGQQSGNRPGAQRESDRAQIGQDLARTLEQVADQLAAAVAPKDDETKELTDQLARAQQLRAQLEGLTRELERLDRQAGQGRGADQTPNQAGGTGPGQTGGNQKEDLARLREDMARQVRETREMLEALRREDPDLAQGGATGFTFEGRGMVLSDPGTEAFKQDFSQWEQLRQQLTSSLEKAESSLSQRLRTRASRDRLASGLDDSPPAEYQQQVDSYFKALATKKKQ